MTMLETAHRQLGLTDSEYERICALMGRQPNSVELAIFSLMWSEHCSYKHSKKLLAKLPSKGPRVVMGPGENAGAVEVADGHVIAFKVESHNHPSAIEPFQGAATGVGGILRDVFAVGAKPIAVLDSLRFGAPDSARSRYLFEQVVAGIGYYGNSHGTPTVGGEVYFEAPYEQNCLVNAMCVGLTGKERLIRSAAVGVGNLVVLLGAATGRDGIGGASVLASAEFGEGDDKRPSVQIGDPFEEKKLMQCCLELLDSGLLVSLQDLGAAGLSSSLSEMASKGGVGFDIDVRKVHLREKDMETFEIMISESQERMLTIVEPGRVEGVLEVCEKWETRASTIGEVTNSRALRVFDGNELCAQIAVSALVADCPMYDLEPQEPDDAVALYPKPKARVAVRAAPEETLLALLASPNVADRGYVFEQYDSIVQGRTARRPSVADAAVLKLSDSGAAIAASIDGNGRRVACDPYRGTIEAVLECARNLACVGAEPVGLTNCLNFGNPEKPHIAWQLTRAVEGMAAACAALEVPVVGGNVSLYNEGPRGPIYPTPVVGMIGELPDCRISAPIGFATAGDWIALLGPFAPSLAGSELASLRGELKAGLPDIDLAAERRLLEVVRGAVRSGRIHSAHDISDGGLAVCVAECAIAAGAGCELDIEPLRRRAGVDAETALFGEGVGGVVASGSRESLLELSNQVEDAGFLALGAVGGSRLKLTCDTATIDVSVEDAKRVFQEAISILLR